jgi:ribosomal protein L11 methyltransferase
VGWLELTVEADVEAVEAVSEICGRLGHGAAVQPTRLIHDPHDESKAREDPMAPYIVTAHIPDDDAAADAIALTERALWHLQAFGVRPVGSLAVRPVAEVDWTEAWKAEYRPQRIGRVVISPSWLEITAEADEIVIRLDPGMAFGTGLHPTTRGCLELLQRIEPMPATVLDVGSGSGILGIAALLLRAQRVVALDTDLVAVQTTAANAKANGVGERLEARQGTLGEMAANRQGPFQLVLANLVATLLVELAERLAAHVERGGTLIASGIIAPRGDEVVPALEGAGLVLVERVDDGEWVSLHMRRAR